MNEEDRKSIGERIDLIRKNKLKMSKVELGEKIGMTGQNLGVVIKGKANSSLPVLFNFCKLANVSSDYILYGNDNEYINLEKIIEVISSYNEKIAKRK